MNFLNGSLPTLKALWWCILTGKNGKYTVHCTSAQAREKCSWVFYAPFEVKQYLPRFVLKRLRQIFVAFSEYMNFNMNQSGRHLWIFLMEVCLHWKHCGGAFWREKMGSTQYTAPVHRQGRSAAGCFMHRLKWNNTYRALRLKIII